MNNSAYKGWNNRATWYYSADILGNNRISETYWGYLAMKIRDPIRLAQAMKTQALKELEDEPCRIVADIAENVIENVNFEEIAEALLKKTLN